MLAVAIERLEAELDAYLQELYEDFLAPFIPAKPEDQPQQFQHKVKAYCVLAHAAFEEFIETLSMWVMESAIDTWMNQRRPTDPLLALCMFYGVRISAVEAESEMQDHCFDALRKAISDAKDLHSKAIHQNHGFSLEYLRRSMTPVFIDVDFDVGISQSLRTLADARGSYAHTRAKLAFFVDNKKASKPMTPEAARDVVIDCVTLCKQLTADASKHFPPTAGVAAPARPTVEASVSAPLAEPAVEVPAALAPQPRAE